MIDNRIAHSAHCRIEGARMFLNIFALIVIGILIAAVIWLVVLLGPWPGKVAQQRTHPRADAIRMLGRTLIGD
jgi:hypothetical protein